MHIQTEMKIKIKKSIHNRTMIMMMWSYLLSTNIAPFAILSR